MLNLDKKWILFTLTWPIFIETSMRLLMGNVSIFMVSRYSDTAVAAIGVSTQIINMTIMIFGIVATGSAIIISQHLGAGDRRTADQAVLAAIWANLLFGMLISAVMVLFASDIARLMNVEGETLAYTALYLKVVGAASFLQALIATIGAVFRNYGFTKVPMLVALVMNIVNIIGNYLSLFEPFGLPQFGVTGVAVSMAAGAVCGALMLVWLFLREFDLKHMLSLCRPFPVHILKSILKIGLPSATESVAYNTSQVMVTFFITYLGTEVLATRIYAYNITTFVYLLGLSVGMGSQILVGYLIGAGRKEQAYRMTFRNLYFAVGVNVFLSAVLIVFREPVFRFFTDNDEIVKLGCLILIVDIFVEIGRAFNHIGNGALRGAGDVKYPMVVNIISTWAVGVLLCYLIGIQWHWGLIGIWFALGIDEWTRGVALMLRWRSRKWESKALIKQER